VLLDHGYPVYVFAWDRNGEFPALDMVDGATVRSFSFGKLNKFYKLGLILGSTVFQILVFFEIIKLVGRLKNRPIVHAHDINTLLPACYLRALRLCCALVYDCREFTYGVYYEWFSLVVASVMSAIEQRCLPCADAVITVSDPIACYLRRFNPVTEIVYNCPRTNDIPKLSKKEARIRLGLPLDSFIISYVGAIRYDSRLDLLLSVARLTEKHNVHFVVVGDGPLASKFRQAAREAASAHLTVLPAVPREMALLYVVASDLTWVVYQNRIESLNARWALPWKFFESLACGVPVVAEGGTIRSKLINELKCGVVLESDDPNDVSRAILWIAAHPDQHLKMCANARYASAAMKFNWEAMSTKLIGVYSRLPWARRFTFGPGVENSRTR